jgi:hypothetical protein
MLKDLQGMFERYTENEIERCASHYRRARDLPNLLRPEDWQSRTSSYIIDRLRRAREAERRRLRKGHWSADRNRFVAIAAALLAEERRTT